MHNEGVGRIQEQGTKEPKFILSDSGSIWINQTLLTTEKWEPKFELES